MMDEYFLSWFLIHFDPLFKEYDLPIIYCENIEEVDGNA